MSQKRSRDVTAGDSSAQTLLELDAAAFNSCSRRERVLESFSNDLQCGCESTHLVAIRPERSEQRQEAFHELERLSAERLGAPGTRPRAPPTRRASAPCRSVSSSISPLSEPVVSPALSGAAGTAWRCRDREKNRGSEGNGMPRERSPQHARAAPRSSTPRRPNAADGWAPCRSLKASHGAAESSDAPAAHMCGISTGCTMVRRSAGRDDGLPIIDDEERGEARKHAVRRGERDDLGLDRRACRPARAGSGPRGRVSRRRAQRCAIAGRSTSVPVDLERERVPSARRPVMCAVRPGPP